MSEPVRADISLIALGFLSYPLAHSRIDALREIIVDYDGPAIYGAVIEVEATCAIGALGTPSATRIDLMGTGRTTIRSARLHLDAATMFGIDTQIPGEIVVTLSDPEGTTIAQHRESVQVLASDEWIAEPLTLGLELLAAHVQPQSVALPAVVEDAAYLLRLKTGRSDFAGYQDEDPERIDAMVEALYETLRTREIRYAEPPPSWSRFGQRIRTPQTVIEGRSGTCLDLTVTMAALLEHVGINATIWVLDGHAFLGYWRSDDALPVVAETSLADAVNRADLGHLRLVETTLLTGGRESAPFADAVRAPHQRLLADGRETFRGVADIRQARLSGILPLPSRSVGEGGAVAIHEYHPATRLPTERVQAPAGEVDTAADSRVRPIPPRVAAWKNALLDLSLRNRLINYTPSAGIAVSVPGPALPQLEDLVNSGSSIELLPSDRISGIARERGIRFARDLPEEARTDLLATKHAHIDITEAAYTGKLRNLAHKAKTLIEETGANNLYLAFGMLNWRFGDRQLRSPLVLVPIRLQSTARGASYRIALDEAGTSTPNYCLLEKLRLTFGLTVPGLADPRLDGSGIDLPAAFAALREALTAAKIDAIVEDVVEISVLQFAKYRLWKDLDENWEELSRNPLVEHLMTTPTEAFVDPIPAPGDVDLDALGTVCPVPADSSQLQAIAEAVAGRTFVLEGPPGTGKSQTITNLLARSLAEGKRVLFVAEKRAALDVVTQRLDEVGLGPFCLDLHDKGARPSAVRAQLSAALAAADPERAPRPDAAALAASTEAVETSRGALTRYADRLHEPNAAGLSLYSARAQQLAADASVRPLPIAPDVLTGLSAEDVDTLRASLRSLAGVADLARPVALHAWGFVDPAPNHAVDPTALTEAALAFDRAIDRAVSAGIGLDDLALTDSPESTDAWATVAGAPRCALDGVDAIAEPVRRAAVTQLKESLERRAATPPPWSSTIDPTVLDRPDALAWTTEVHAAATAADESFFIGRRKRRRAVLEQLRPALRGDAASVPLDRLGHMTGQLLADVTDVQGLTRELEALPVRVLDRALNPWAGSSTPDAVSRLSWLAWLADALAPTANPAVGSAALREYWRDIEYSTAQPSPVRAAALSALAAAWRSLSAASGMPDGAESIVRRWSEWAGGRAVTDAWVATRGTRGTDATGSFETKPGTPSVALQRWLALVAHLEPLRRHRLGVARAGFLNGTSSADDASLAFDRGIADASVIERGEATALGDFDAVAHNRSVTRFVTNSDAIRAELPTQIPADILNERPFQPGSAGGDMGLLTRQLALKRGGSSVRALMEDFGDLITQITPCMLMSPESVARFFPARAEMFDVVVFDEASQIRVADAIGAMGRGRSVVVVGDSKQMPPTTFAEVSLDSDDEEERDTAREGVADEESILTECVQARVPSIWLSWHYRSQDETLIAFSNQQYYQGRLSSFPAPRQEGDPEFGVSLVRVEGTFDRSGTDRLRTNRVEAEAIVAEVARRFAGSPEATPSLGIITFNAPQRTLIEELLRDAADERIAAALDEPDGLFVKNLENVQGDERDTILFSVAFSANQRGVIPLNFGPLSRTGGERRLNVAITRARRRVILFASFDPSALRAEQTTAVGLSDLKAYLQLAQDGTEAAGETVRGARVIDRHRDEIASELRRRGYAVATDVGLSGFRVDLSIATADDPATPLVAVLLDGEGWRRRRTVADRDGLPISVLRRVMGWPAVERVWLPEWLADREETLTELEESVARAAHR